MAIVRIVIAGLVLVLVATWATWNAILPDPEREEFIYKNYRSELIPITLYCEVGFNDKSARENSELAIAFYNQIRPIITEQNMGLMEGANFAAQDGLPATQVQTVLTNIGNSIDGLHREIDEQFGCVVELKVKQEGPEN